MLKPYHPALVVLIGLNLLLFLVGQTGSDPEDFDLGESGALWALQNRHYRTWQWFSHMFLHSGLLHLAFNMYGLGMFGAPLLRVWRTRRFLLLYFAAGLAGAALQWIANGIALDQDITAFAAAQGIGTDAVRTILDKGYGPAYLVDAMSDSLIGRFNMHMLGASGAVFGVLAAFSLRYPKVPLMLVFVPVPVQARYFVLGIVGYELFAEFTGVSLFGGGIAHLAHVGGALAGWLLGRLWLGKDDTRPAG